MTWTVCDFELDLDLYLLAGSYFALWVISHQGLQEHYDIWSFLANKQCFVPFISEISGLSKQIKQTTS